jgi:uncharacterized protein (TIGR03000 family)
MAVRRTEQGDSADDGNLHGSISRRSTARREWRSAVPELSQLIHRISPALSIAFLFTASAAGQSIGTSTAPLVSAPGFAGPGSLRGNPAPVDQSWRYYGLRNGPRVEFTDARVGIWNWGWAGTPAASGSFWTNGLSLYGPPVPTYAPVPGTFGGADAHRFYINPPVFGFGLNPLGYRSPSPAPVPLPPPTSARCARLEVKLPSTDAEVWVNETKTSALGAARSFESPDLVENTSYEYKLVARWVQDGESKAESRTISVTAGVTRLVDFTKPKE